MNLIDKATEYRRDSELSRRLKSPAAGLLMLLLGACAVPGWLPLGDTEQGAILATGESATVHFFTNIANFDTELGLQAGARYELDIRLLSNWRDGYIDKNERNTPLDEHGFANKLMPLESVSILKRSRQHKWFELMLFQANCKSGSLRGISDLNFDEASGSYNFVATCDGKLSLFVNDSYGFYGNNSGFASISLSRVN